MILSNLIFFSFFSVSALALSPNSKSLNISFINTGRIFPPFWNAKNFLQLEKQELIAELNEYSVILLSEINNFILDQGFDPLPMKDLVTGFQWTIFSGEMSLKKGWLQGISTLIRSSDVTIKYNYPIVKLHLPLSFEVLQLEYDYVIQFMGIGPNGLMTGSVEGCKYTIDIDLDLTTLRTKLGDFKLNTLGRVKLKFHGGIIEWMLNIFLSVAVPLVTPIIRLVLDGFLQPSVENIINTYNNLIEQILGLPDL